MPEKGWRSGLSRGLMALLPRDFRERHGEEMLLALEEHLRERGRPGRAAVWLRFAADTVWMAAVLRGSRRRRRRSGREDGTGHGTTGKGTMGDGTTGKGATAEALARDLAFAFRALRRRPGFTAVVILTLALGVGADTAVFSVVNGVLLRPLPYRDAERIGILWHEFGDGAQDLPALHPLDLYDYRERSRLFEGFTLASGRELILGGPDDPELVDVGLVETGFFGFFGVEPLHGRTFTPEEDLPGAARVAMLSHRVWARRFGADPEIVGGTVDLGGGPVEVVGVLPPSFRLALPAEAFLLTDAEVWIPARIDRDRLPPRNFTGFTAFGRIRPGIGFDAAEDELELLAGQLRSEHPVHATSNLRVRITPLLDDVVKGTRRTLLLLMAAVGLVFLVACANIANLVLVRGHVRAGELALRSALGAGRRGLVRLVLCESLLLAAAGAGLGLVLARVSVDVLRELAATSVPRMGAVTVDGRVLLFLGAVTVLSVAFFGLLPALAAARRHPAEALTSGAGVLTGGRGGGHGPGRSRVRDALVVGEVAASLVLLVGTGLMIRTAVALGDVDPGYATEGLLSFRVSLPASFEGVDARQAFIDELFESLAARPKVEGVAGVSQLPLTGSGPLQPYAWNEETRTAWESVTADQRWATPGFFDVVGARLVAGREFTREDTERGNRIIVDRRLADRAFPGGEAVGRLLQVNPDEDPEEIRYARIVGVVDHLRLHDLGRPHLTQIWWPLRGSPRFTVVVRTAGDPHALVPVVRGEVGRLAPGAPVEDVRTMEELTHASLAPVRLAVDLMTGFGVVALLLAAVGVYGVLSRVVGQRSREIGIRMALGETPDGARRSVLAMGMRRVAVAVVLGLAGATVVSRAASGLLYAVEPVDPLTYGGTALVLVGVGLLACWIPARRATRVDPAVTLRG